jgi:protein SCO1
LKLKHQPCRLASLLLLLVTCQVGVASPAPERTLLATPPRPLSDFELTNQTSKSVRLSDLRGAPVLVFFGFTHCPDVCPTALEQLRQLEQQYRADLGATRIVIVSVDGERDSAQALAAWLKPISGNFIGLTGAPDKVRDIAREFSAAFYKTRIKNASEYLIEHNSQIFLVDAEGHLRATFFNAPTATIAQVTRSVTRTRGEP